MESDDEHPERTPGESYIHGKYQAAIISGNGLFLPGYSNDFVRRLGDSVAAGLRTEFRVHDSLFEYHSISLKLSIRDEEDIQEFMTVNFLIDSPSSVTKMPTRENWDTLAKRFGQGRIPDKSIDLGNSPHMPMDYSKMAKQARETWAEHLKRNKEHTWPDIAFMGHTTEEITAIDLNVNIFKVFITYNQGFWNSMETQSHSRRYIATSVDEYIKALTIPSDENITTFPLQISFPSDNISAETWAEKLKVRPIQTWAPILHLKEPEELHWTDYDMDIYRPDFPIPATDWFHNSAHRTVSLVFGAADEANLDKIRAIACAGQSEKVAVIPVHGSEWLMHEPDTLVGMDPTGEATRLYVVVKPTDNTRLRQPEVGNPVSICFRTKQSYHPPPAQNNNPGILHRATAQLCDKIDMAIIRACAAKQHREKELTNAATERATLHTFDDDGARVTEAPDPKDLEIDDDQVQSAYWDAYVKELHPMLANFLEKLTDAQLATHKAEVEKNEADLDDTAKTQVTWATLRRSKIAAMAYLLHPEEKEDDIKHRSRVVAWIVDHPPSCLPPETEYGISCRGSRIQPPHGITNDLIWYHVTVPRQPNWPPGYDAPYITTNLTHVEIPKDLRSRNLGQFLEQIFMDESKSLEEAKIFPRTNDKSTKTECQAVYQMNHMEKGSPTHAWWDYLLDFDKRKIGSNNVNLLERFPSLHQKFHNGHWKDDTQTHQAIDALQRTFAGKVVISGCPSSGKSTFGGIIAQEVVLGVQKQDACGCPVPVLPPLQPEMDAKIESELNPTANTAELRAFEMSAGSHKIAVPQKPMITSSSTPDPPPSQDPNPPVAPTEPIIPQQDAQEVERQQRWDKLPKAGQTKRSAVQTHSDDPRAKCAFEGARRGRVAWVTAQNAQADDAVQRFKRMTSITVARVYDYDAELSNVLRKTGRPFQSIRNPTMDASPVDRMLNRHMHGILKESFLNKNVSEDPSSLSNIAKRRVEGNPRWVTITEAWKDRDEDQASWVQNKAEYKNKARELIEETLRHTDIVCGTPVAIYDLFNHSTWTPDLVEIDEAGRVPEPMTFAPIAKYRDTPTLILGDPKQFGPVSTSTYITADKTFDGFYYRSLFGPQRGESLIHRMSAIGSVDIVLNRNYRAFGDVANYACRFLYHGNMHMVNRHRTNGATLAAKWIKSLCPGSLFQSAFVDLTDGKEEKAATSYINPASAGYVVELAVQTFQNSKIPQVDDPSLRGRVLIITGYAMQKRLIQARLDELSPAEIPKGAVTVRTIDDSASHQAETVIVDLVRTRAIGFMAERPRMIVMTTRAHYACIYVGNGNLMEKGRSRQSHHYKWLKENQSTVSISGAIFCTHCLRFGHLKAKCDKDKAKCGKERVTCNICKSARNQTAFQSGRGCKNNDKNLFMASFKLDIPIPETDNLQRDIKKETQLVVPSTG